MTTGPEAADSIADFDVDAVRREFPIFDHKLPGDRELHFLDSGASTQKPRCVLDKEREVAMHAVRCCGDFRGQGLRCRRRRLGVGHLENGCDAAEHCRAAAGF